MKLRESLLSIAPAFAVGLLYAAIVTARATASFPFARTLISCAQLTPANIYRGNSSWSGSATCGNPSTVVADATFVRGLAQGVDFVVQCLCVPVLSHMSDSFGRRPLALFAVFGLLVASVTLWLSAWTGSTAWFVVSVTVQGATSVISPIMSAVAVDGTDGTDRQRIAAFGLYAGATLIVLVFVVAVVTLAVVAQHTYDYVTFSLVLLGLNVLLLGHTWAYYPETIRHIKPWARENMFPLRSYRLFLRDKQLGWLACALFLLGFGTAAINVLQGFVVTVYGWSNESSIYIYMFALAVLAVSAMSGSPVIARIGSYNALKLGILVVASGFIVLIFAQASPALAYIGILVMASGGFASPAFLTIISTLVSSSEQGELQGAVNSVVLLSSGLGAVFHSAIFTWVKHTSIGASLPFLLGAVCVLASFGATGVAMWSPYRRGRSTDASPLQLPASPAVGHIDAGVELPQLAPPAPAPPEDSSDVIPLRPFNE